MPLLTLFPRNFVIRGKQNLRLDAKQSIYDDSRMKRKALAIGLLSVLVLLACGGAFLWRTAEEHNWLGHTRYNISIIGSSVEVFREKHGRYPTSFSVLLLEPLFTGDSNLVALLSGMTGTEFKYEPSSNLFTIVAVKPAGVFSKRKHVTVTYRYGEANKISDEQFK